MRFDSTCSGRGVRSESAVPSKTAFDGTLRGSDHNSQDHVGRVLLEESPGAGALFRRLRN